MAALVYTTLGWELAHPRITSAAIDNPDALAQTDVLFLAIDCVGDIWARAIGEPVRSFRSASLERDAWQRLLGLVRALRQLIERGGRIVCRLDLPTSSCQVRERPNDPRFPTGNELNPYLALAGVHPAFAAIAASVGQLETSELYLAGSDHPLADYLQDFAAELVPQVALKEKPEGASCLAHTSAGFAVALAWESLVFLPASQGLDPHDDARVLLETVERWIGDRAASSPKTAAVSGTESQVPGLDQLARMEREITQRIHDLELQRDSLRRQRAARERLWRLMQITTGEEFRTSVTQALEVLGLPVVDDEQTPGVVLEGHVEMLPGALRNESGFILRGRLQRGRRTNRRLTFHAPHSASPGIQSNQEASARASRNPARPLIDRAERLDETLVPISELLEAVTVVLMSPPDEPLIARIRQSLADCTGLYRFEINEIVTPDERATLMGR